jgi:hypothetical protein
MIVAFAVSLAGASASAQDIVPGLAQEFANTVASRDLSILSSEEKTILVWWDPRVTPVKVERISAEALLEKLDGCHVTSISDGSGEASWVCKDRPSAEKCFDEAYFAVVKRYGTRVVARVAATDEWSTNRCGKKPLFAPPAPPKTNG